MKKIVHIITGLGSGGAENMLYKVLKHADLNRYKHEVISLLDKGIYGDVIEGLGIKVHSLNMNKYNVFTCIAKAVAVCKDCDLVDTWLYHADLFGYLIAKVFLRKKIIWNTRHCNLDKDVNKLITLKVVKLNSLLSRYVDCITFNSKRALDNHIYAGYKARNLVVIPNGFELNKFRFDINDRNQVREQLNLDDEKVIITVGVWDIQKDYYTLLQALSMLKKHNPKFKMIMVGPKLDYLNKELADLIQKYNLDGNMVLLGRREDITALLSAADIYISSSLGESFSNAIGEAMSCELTCVVTNVGDSKYIVGETGLVVEAGNYIDMAAVLLGYIEKTSSDRNKKARERVIENYDIEVITRGFEDNWGENFYKSKH